MFHPIYKSVFLSRNADLGNFWRTVYFRNTLFKDLHVFCYQSVDDLTRFSDVHYPLLCTPQNNALFSQVRLPPSQCPIISRSSNAAIFMFNKPNTVSTYFACELISFNTSYTISVYDNRFIGSIASYVLFMIWLFSIFSFIVIVNRSSAYDLWQQKAGKGRDTG